MTKKSIGRVMVSFISTSVIDNFTTAIELWTNRAMWFRVNMS